MAEDKKADPRTVMLKNVRLSFSDGLVEKKASVKDAVPKYSCNLILVTETKEFAENQAKVIAAIRAAGEQAFGNPDAYKAIAEDSPKRLCFRKGERFKNDDGEVYKGYAGNWGISAAGGPMAGQKRCKIMDRRKREITDAEEIAEVCYGGTFADVKISFYGASEGGRGIFASIDGIRSREEGERMGNFVSVSADEFDDLEDDNSFDDDKPKTTATSDSGSDF